MSTVIASAEKPQNGIAGFKHLRQDIVSGIVVSLVSLPLSSGIAIASGVPPVYGLISAIIAGLIFPFIGGAYQTIAGPAAGLAPALFMIMGWMGGVGDSSKVGEGYHFLLCVVFMVGVIQIVLAIMKLARFAGIIPVSVVEGMLASIGLMIIVKQVSLLLGYLAPTSGDVPHPHEFIDFIQAVPHYVEHMRVNVFAVGAATLVMLFVLDAMSKRFNFLKIIPPQLLAVIFGLILGRIIHIGALEKTLISLPGNPFEHGVSFPNFAELMTRSDLWQAAIVAVIMLTMIDGVESLATAMAIDRIDPFKRKSEPNRVLLAMGISNIASSLVGGLTIIPGGVKSKANIASGGRTLWANFTNAICLIIYMLVARDVINMIPLTVLAAVLIFTGWKMCEPMVWSHMAHIGKEQLAIFTFTIIATLYTDLLIGIVAGIVATWLLDVSLYWRAYTKTTPAIKDKAGLTGGLLGMFANPISKREMRSKEFHITIDRPVVCFNSMKLSEVLDSIPAEAEKAIIHINKSALLIDHTACENLMYAVEQNESTGTPIIVEGLECMRRLSDHHACVHVHAPELVVS